MDYHGKCSYCDADATKKCAKCKLVWYCSKEHQKLDWKDHRIACKGSLHCHPVMKHHTCVSHQHCNDGGVVTDVCPRYNAHKDSSIPTQEDLIAALFQRADLKHRDGLHSGLVESFVDVRLCFNLHAETDKPPYNKIPGMMNLFCHPDAKLIKCTATDICKNGKAPLDTKLEELDLDDDEAYALSKKEFRICAFRENQIQMQSGATYRAPDGKSYFSVRDLVNVILKDEEVKRVNEENFWFGGIDVQNIIFEGLKYKNNVYRPQWGS